MILLSWGLAWIAGICAGSVFRLPQALLLVAAIPLALVFARRYRKKAIVTGLAVLLFVSGAGYSYHSQFDITPEDLRYYNDLGEMQIEGRIITDPDVRDTSTRLEIEAARLIFNGAVIGINGKALVFVPRYPEYRYGDVVDINGIPQTPSVLEDFDYRGYLEHQGISTVIYYPSVEVVAAGQGNAVMTWIYSLRSRLSDVLAEVLPEPQASLAQGMLLGVRGNIPQDVRDDFNRSGAAHLLAISGLHLGIVAGLLLACGISIFGRKRGIYVWLALVGIWVYAVLTGLHAPVVRGAIMASLFLIAEGLGRQRSGLIALVVAAAIMVGIEPYILGDASFQLSFLAMVGLIAVYPLLRDIGRSLVTRILGEDRANSSSISFTIDTFSAALASTLAVWPVVAYYFGMVSLAGPLVTFLALPALAGIIVFAGLAAVTGMAVPVIGQVFGWAAWLWISWVLFVTDWFGSHLPSVVTMDSLHPVLLWVYYGLAAVIVGMVYRWQRRRTIAAGTSGLMRPGITAGFLTPVGWKWVLVPLLVIAVLTVVVAAAVPDDTVTVSFLDVGQGDAILVRQGSTQVLIDGGPAPQAIVNCLGERMPFWDRTIEVVMLTHPHADHLAGLVEVLRRYDVKQVVVPLIGNDSALYRELLRLTEEKGTLVTVAFSGCSLSSGDMTFNVLHPSAGSVTDDDENALVLRLETGDASFLFTSDIPGEVESELIRRRADIDVDVLKVAHHGSDDSSTAAFLAVVSPEVALISCGEGNRYGHPGSETLARLEEVLGEEKVYRTDEDGSVDITCKDHVLRITTGAN